MNLENKNKKYKTNNFLVYSCQYHVIFCTKYRRKVLSEEIQNRLKEIINQKQEEYDYQVLELETMPDHVHLLLDVNPQLGIHKTVSRIKGITSNILRNEFASLRSRLPTLWTKSKFISTVGEVSLQTVKQYIEDQKNR